MGYINERMYHLQKLQWLLNVKFNLKNSKLIKTVDTINM